MQDRALTRRKITKRLVEGLKPATKEVRSKTTGKVTVKPVDLLVWDTELTGFGVRVTKAGSIAFVLRYVAGGGRERRYTIDQYPTLSVSAARGEALKLLGDIKKGRDPLEDREAQRKAPTVAALADDYMERHAKHRKSELSRREDIKLIDNHIVPALGKRKVADVRLRDVDGLHKSLSKTPYHANRVLALLSKMFSLAMKWDLRADNPCKGVERFNEEKRDRWLSEEEVARLLEALDFYSDRTGANVLKLLLLTGARRGEALTLKWEDVDFRRGVWRKPSHHTKQKKTEHVPLSPQALTLLLDLRKRADAAEEGGQDPSEYVFPGDGPKGHFTEPKFVWHDVCVRAGLAEIVAYEKNKKGEEIPIYRPTARIHDLRHTYASHLVSRGLSLEQVGKLLGHTQAATTQRYAHLSRSSLQEATNIFGAMTEALEDGRKPAEVVLLPRKQQGSS